MWSINADLFQEILKEVKDDVNREYGSLKSDDMDMIRHCILEAFETLEDNIRFNMGE
jgi:hypothetical protein